MELRIFTEPQQGATYDDLLRVALQAERLGFGAFFRSDHYLKMGSVSGLPGPTDAWITLAGLARDTSTIRLGTLVTAGTFRLPGPLAISVAQVDQMSGGRVELGIGTGWFEAEHTAYGIPFPSVPVRFERLEEELEIITGLWNTPIGGSFTYAGQHFTLSDSPALPKPVQTPLPIIIGGSGMKKTPSLAARFAAEYNVPFQHLEHTKAAFDRVRAACDAAERPAPIFSATQIVCLGASDAHVTARAAAIGRDVAELTENGLTGTVDAVATKLAAYADAGTERMYLQILDLADDEHLELIAEQVMPTI